MRLFELDAGHLQSQIDQSHRFVVDQLRGQGTYGVGPTGLMDEVRAHEQVMALLKKQGGSQESSSLTSTRNPLLAHDSHFRQNLASMLSAIVP